MKKDRPSAKNNWGCSPEWKTSPISPTCETTTGKGTYCGKPTDLAYPASGGGWHAMCLKHGLKHLRYGGALKIEALIQGGERFEH